VSLPPLRERREDLPALCRQLIQTHAADLGRPAPQLSREAVAVVQAHPWPGNVRELSNALERAVLLADGAWITPEDLPMRRSSGRNAGPTNLKDAVALFEGAHITRVLADCDGDKAAAADALGVHLATLYRHLERLGS